MKLNNIVSMTKKAVEQVTKKVTVKVEKKICPNCNNSGMTCRECGTGMTA